MTESTGIVMLTEVPPEKRDQWRHELNTAAYRLNLARDALGVPGQKEPSGSLGGLLDDLEEISRQADALRTEASGYRCTPAAAGQEP